MESLLHSRALKPPPCLSSLDALSSPSGYGARPPPKPTLLLPKSPSTVALAHNPAAENWDPTNGLEPARSSRAHACSSRATVEVVPLLSARASCRPGPSVQGCYFNLRSPISGLYSGGLRRRTQTWCSSGYPVGDVSGNRNAESCPTAIVGLEGNADTLERQLVEKRVILDYPSSVGDDGKPKIEPRFENIRGKEQSVVAEGLQEDGEKDDLPQKPFARRFSTVDTAFQGETTYGSTGNFMPISSTELGQSVRNRKSSSEDKLGILSSPQKVRRFSLENIDFQRALQKEGSLTPAELEQLGLLRKFKYANYSSKGTLIIRALRVEQLKETEELLTESFAELMWGMFTYRPLLAWTVQRYLMDRLAALPHTVTLVGLYASAEENVVIGRTVDPSSCNWTLAGTVEVSFNAKGQPGSPPSPLPPRDAPFLCNMAVQKEYRRRGIGWQLLKAAEELAGQLECKEMYLHCRMIDTPPLLMYKKAGYKVVATDSILSLLTFQRRRYLMNKRLLCES